MQIRMIKTPDAKNIPNGTVGELAQWEDMKTPGSKFAVFNDYLYLVYRDEIEIVASQEDK